MRRVGRSQGAEAEGEVILDDTDLRQRKCIIKLQGYFFGSCCLNMFASLELPEDLLHATKY